MKLQDFMMATQSWMRKSTEGICTLETNTSLQGHCNVHRNQYLEGNGSAMEHWTLYARRLKHAWQKPKSLC